MAADKRDDAFADIPSADALGEGATRMFQFKLESWMSDIPGLGDAVEGAAPAANPAPVPAAPAGQPLPAPAAASFAPPTLPTGGVPPASASPFAPPTPAPSAPFAVPTPFAPFAPPASEALAPPAGRVSSPDLSAHAGPADPPAGRLSSPDLGPAASAVPPIPALASSAVPPIPALAGPGLEFEEPPRRWPLVVAAILMLALGGAAAGWVFYGPQIRAFLKI